MNTTQQLLEEAKRFTGAQTDYALGKRLGWGHSKVSNYRCGRSQMDVDACFVLAELLGKDPAAIIAAVEAERATKPEAREAWLQRLKQLGGVAAMWVCFAVLSALPAPADAAVAHKDMTHRNVHTLLFSEVEFQMLRQCAVMPRGSPDR